MYMLWLTLDHAPSRLRWQLHMYRVPRCIVALYSHNRGRFDFTPLGYLPERFVMAQAQAMPASPRIGLRESREKRVLARNGALVEMRDALLVEPKEEKRGSDAQLGVQ